jgi:hypothetical protein
MARDDGDGVEDDLRRLLARARLAPSDAEFNNLVAMVRENRAAAAKLRAKLSLSDEPAFGLPPRRQG